MKPDVGGLPGRNEMTYDSSVQRTHWNELLGDLVGPAATVNRAGTVAPLDTGWQVDWAIGSPERWHIATAETAVRSRLLDDMPVAVTAMRVPGGDIVSSAAVVCDGSRRAVVMEFTNQTSTPVSLALAVTPRGAGVRRNLFRRGPLLPALATESVIKHAEVSGSTVIADGRVALELGRSPGGAAAVTDGDPWSAVKAKPPAGDCAASNDAGCAAAVVVLPLASTASRRVSIPIECGPVLTTTPAEAASGWSAVVAHAASFQSEDQTASKAWRKGIAASILAAGHSHPDAAARAACVLDQVGLHSEADRGRATTLNAFESSNLTSEDALLTLQALASRRLRSGHASGLDEYAGPLVALANRSIDITTMEQVIACLTLEAPSAAADARRLLADLERQQIGATPVVETPKTASYPLTLPAGTTLTDPSVDLSPPGSADNASSTNTADSTNKTSITGIESILARLVADPPGHLIAAPAFPEHWMGMSVDVRSLCTRHGCFSFSVRWHGHLPALLWQLEPSKGSLEASTTERVEIRCGLAPGWSSVEPTGEALLPGRGNHSRPHQGVGKPPEDNTGKLPEQDFT